MKRILPILTLAAMVGVANAQQSMTTATDTLPPGPIIAQPQNADWQIVVTEQPEPPPVKGESPPKPVPPLVTTSRVTKSGQIYRKATAAPGGAITTRWAKGALEFVVRADTPRPIMISRAGLSTDYVDFSKTAFPELSWITRENYVHVEAKSGVKCYVFKAHVATTTEVSPGQINGTPGPDAADHTAYINVDTHLPVEMDYSHVTYIYTYSATPPAELALPPEFNRLQREKKTEEDQLARRPASS